MKKVEHGNLQREVYRKLYEWIVQGYFPDGCPLKEEHVARQMGVSRTPVREAFRQLELDGLVKAHPNRSITVHSFSDQDILDLYAVRSCLENLAVVRAAGRITDKQLLCLKGIFLEEKDLLAEESFDLDTFVKLDAKFHDQICLISDSPVLKQMLQSISQQIQKARTVTLADHERRQNHLKEHAAVLKALSERDSAKAQQAMTGHIQNAAATYRAGCDSKRGTRS